LSRLTRLIRFLRHWHARIGVVTAVFLIFLSLTGLSLNHTDALRLTQREITSSWLMRWYGLKQVIPTRGYLFKDGYLAASDGRWLMDGKIIAKTNSAPVGAISWGNMRAVANVQTLYLFSSRGLLIDKLSGDVLPASPINHLGELDSELVIKTAQGSFVTNDGLTWKPLAKGQPKWASEQVLPNSTSASLNLAFAPSLSLERIILDLHSGRIFGRYGPMVMDISALVLITLSLSGMWMYLRLIRKKSG